jgi:hypothetical protein
MRVSAGLEEKIENIEQPTFDAQHPIEKPGHASAVVKST